MEKKRACVVVLGDVGRSPRIQYHALSLATEGFDVDIVGYTGSEILKDLSAHSSVTLRAVPTCPDFQKYFPCLIGYALKVWWQCFTLFFTLLLKPRPNYVLLQTPPAIPSILICGVYCLLVQAVFIIDWHNYGHTLMALSLGRQHFLVRLSKWFEGYFGRMANAHLCVTKAMKTDLMQQYNIRATTLYDRPPEHFRPISLEMSHNLFTRLGQEYEVFISSKVDKTAFTEINETGSIILRDDRPGLLVSSTSWTEDEDFSILLSALQCYEDTRIKNINTLPALLCVITGKGPMKDYYCNIIEKKKWKHVQVITPWLQPDDYSQILASADIGVCLHISSSGLDLPMKVADMFGCGLPVCAYNFPCLDELVQNGKNSYVFSNTEELALQILSWFEGFPHNEVQKEVTKYFKAELKKYQSLRWHENWLFHTAGIFT